MIGGKGRPCVVPTQLAALAAGVSEATIRKWASRGMITRYGRPGRAEYDVGELVEIAARRDRQRGRRRQRAGTLECQVRDKNPGRMVGMPLPPSPSVPVRAPYGPRNPGARIHSGRRRPGIAPRNA